MKNIILLAVQGAGKGTLAKKLSEKYGYVHISMGDILRERASKNDELGKKIKSLIDSGIFVSNDIIFAAIEDKITSPECINGYILDGFPRNIEQAKGYDELLKKVNKDLGIVINLTVPMELLTNRIIGRRMCQDCGAIYNIYNTEMMPKHEGICDKCSGKLYQRDDDNMESMKTRVDTYYKVTAPIIDYYRDKGILYELDATNFDSLLENVDNLLHSWGNQ